MISIIVLFWNHWHDVSEPFLKNFFEMTKGIDYELIVVNNGSNDYTESGIKKWQREYKQIKAIHLNDSKKELGSKVDRHEHIGKGFIGLEGFRCIMNDKRFIGVPKVLETPKGEDMKEDVMNLKVLRGLVQRSKNSNNKAQNPK